MAELLQEPLPTPPDLSDFNLPSEEILGASQVGRKNNFNLLLNSDRKILEILKIGIILYPELRHLVVCQMFMKSRRLKWL